MFLRSLFETKAKGTAGDNGFPGQGDSVARAVAAAGTNVVSKQPLSVAGQWDAEAAIRNGYEKVIWIFRCVDVIASNQAGLTIQMRKGFDRRNGEVIENERLWKLLNFRANGYESSWQFRYRVSSQALLSRRGAFIEIVRAKDGLPAGLHLLPVGKTEPIPDPERFVAGYKVTRADNSIDVLAPDRVIWIRMKPHPVDPYAQMTPLVAAGIEADTDYLARIFNRNFLANDGRPGMLITIDPGAGILSPEDAEVIKQRFSGGPAMAGQTTVIEAAGISAQDLSANPRDVQWDQLLAASKERLLLAFGVPESVMGNASGRTFDNADAERENFWMDTMIPHCNNLAFSLDVLTGDIYDDQRFVYNYEEVDVLQRVAAARRDEWRGEVGQGLRSVDEYRDAAGYEPFGVLRTQTLYLPNGVPVARNPEDQKLADEFKPITPPAPAGAPGAAAQGQFSGQVSALERATSKWGNQIAARIISMQKAAEQQPVPPQTYEAKAVDAAPKAQVVVPDSDHDFQLEAYLEGALAAIDDRQRDVFGDRLTHVKFRKGTRHWKEGSA